MRDDLLYDNYTHCYIASEHMMNEHDKQLCKELIQHIEELCREQLTDSYEFSEPAISEYSLNVVFETVRKEMTKYNNKMA